MGQPQSERGSCQSPGLNPARQRGMQIRPLPPPNFPQSTCQMLCAKRVFRKQENLFQPSIPSPASVLQLLLATSLLEPGTASEVRPQHCNVAATGRTMSSTGSVSPGSSADRLHRGPPTATSLSKQTSQKEGTIKTLHTSHSQYILRHA